MKQENVCVHIATEKQLNSSRFTSKIIVLCYYYQNTISVVCFFLQLPGCWSYEEEINCEYAQYALPHRYNIVCSSLPVYCSPSSCLSTFSCFFTPTPNLYPSPLYSALESILPWKFFRVEISISSWISYAIILMCY